MSGFFFHSGDKIFRSKQLKEEQVSFSSLFKVHSTVAGKSVSKELEAGGPSHPQSEEENSKCVLVLSSLSPFIQSTIL